MTADLLISTVLNEGRKVVLVTRTDYDKSKRYSTPEIDQRSNTIYPNGGSGKGLNNPRNINDIQYGVSKSRNHHLNAVVRHVLPSLGSLLGDTYEHKNGNYSSIKSNISAGKVGFEFLGSTASGKEREVWDEYDRHLTDLANHIHKHTKRRDKKIKVIGMSTTRDGTVPDSRHDDYEHGGYGFDVSRIGEVLAVHISDSKYGGMKNVNPFMVHKGDKYLASGTVDSIKSMLDTFYRGGKYFSSTNLNRKLGKEVALSLSNEHPNKKDRIIRSSRKISIPAGWGIRSAHP